jgi:hypothetical protein
MIKLFIQGRKDGYRVLYPKPTPTEFFQFAGDLRPDGNNNQLLGKSFYSLAFAPGGHIFTKQLIIQDVQRQGLGNIGFSLFIPAQKKMPGEQAIELLDELVKTYYLNYCPDYYLDFVQEDWAIFENIVSKYHVYLKNKFQEDLENHAQGADDPAYLYYSDVLELQRFFDAPAQEEYAQFKQVFFIDKSLESQSNNPLKAIRHNSNGNLTGKIDLNNQSYRLIYTTLSQGGVRLEVKVNGMPLLNKNQIKRKDHLEITWSKAYHESSIIKGTSVDIGPPYLLINEDSKTITIKDIALNERTFKFHVKAVDKFSRPINDAELVAYSQNNKRERPLVNNSIILKEEELNENYYVIGRKGNLESEPKALAKMGAIEEITLTLLETVKLTIKPLDSRNGNYVPDAKITFVNMTNSTSGYSAEFRGDEVNKNWQIIIAHPEYRTKTITYSPATDTNEKVVQLEKLPSTEVPSQPQHDRKSYRLVIDPKKGKETWKGDQIDLTGREFQQDKIRCDAKYGYKFSNWEKVETKGQLEIYEAIFDDLWYRKIPKPVLVIIPVFITVGISYSLKDLWGGQNPNLTSSSNTESYLNGNELKLDSLESLKKNCVDPKYLSENKEFCSEIDNAISFRKYIDQGELDSLFKAGKNLFISAKQKEIKIKIIKLLEEINQDTSSISNINWDVKDLNLDEIGKKLDFLIIKKMEESPENQQDEGDSSSEDKQNDPGTNESPPANRDDNKANTKVTPSPTTKNETADFNKELNALLKQGVFPTTIVWKNFLKDIKDENNRKKITFIIENIGKIKDLPVEDRQDYESIKREINQN